MATQEERRAETRARLLEAAAELFAERGIEGSSIEAIAARADRTSGALYDHFGSKDGLLFALLETWVGDVATVIGAELATAATLDERLLALWRNVADPPSGDGRWIALEHELWSYAARHDEARDHLARRYRSAWAAVDAAAADWLAVDVADGPGAGAALIGTLLGLEMMHRLDPSAVTDDLAVAALRGVVTSLPHASPTTTS